jgi:hypothetical protein
MRLASDNGSIGPFFGSTLENERLNSTFVPVHLSRSQSARFNRACYRQQLSTVLSSESLLSRVSKHPAVLGGM